MGGDLQPIVDANAKEERLATARLSVCLNIFEDVCGMQTLGQMDIDPVELIECSKTALKIAKETTKLAREAWANRDKVPLLSMTIRKQPVDIDNTVSAQQFINNLKQDVKMKSDTEDNTEVKEEELIDLIKQSR